MIAYTKTGYGLHLLLRVHGSAVLRTFIFAALAAAEAAILYAFVPVKELEVPNRVNTTFPAFATVISLLLIFRQNTSYTRYHEGRVNLQKMTASFYSSCALALSFDGGSKSGTFSATASSRRSGSDPSAESFRLGIIHAYSMLHAACVQYLRCDWDLDNLTAHDEDCLPPWDAASTPGYTTPLLSYVYPTSRMTARDALSKVCKVPVIGGVSHLERTALKHGKTTRLQTMTRRREKTEAADLARHSSHPSTSFTDNSNGNGSGSELRSRSARVTVNWWTSETGENVRGAAERPNVLYYAVMERLRKRITEGGLDMPPPIAAVMWQDLLVGWQGFETCRYLSDTPFPFPWAQMVVFCLVLWQFLIPFSAVVAYDNQVLGIIMAGCTVWILWALNEVARAIEDPFVSVPNDLPLARLQYQFNEKLLAISCPDVVDLVDEAAVGEGLGVSNDMDNGRAVGVFGGSVLQGKVDMETGIVERPAGV